MATKETWDKLRYFKPDSVVDRWGDPDLINDELLLALDDFRHHHGSPVIVTAGVSEYGHSANSYHYPSNGACALDFVTKSDKNTVDLIMDVLRFGFTGVGYYPYWKLNGETVGGFHVDMRPLQLDQDGTKNYRHNRWMGVPSSKGLKYIALTYQNLVKYGGI